MSINEPKTWLENCVARADSSGHYESVVFQEHPEARHILFQVDGHGFSRNQRVPQRMES